MNNQGKLLLSLEEQYRAVFKGAPLGQEVDDYSLEQPYFAQVVQTVTTYSVSEKPESISE